MKALFTFKPVDYFLNPHMFGGVAEIDLSSGEIGRVLRIPSASFKSKRAFMTNFVQGLCLDESYIYASGWNFVVIIDPQDFKIIDSFSTREMADIHSLAVDENNIYVISTATECLICFDKKSLIKKWVWGPNEGILNYNSLSFLPNLPYQWINKYVHRFGLRKYLRTPKYRNNETRYVHKNNSPYYRHHLNNVSIFDNYLFLNTKGWFNTTSSAVIKLNKESLESSFFVKPNTFIGSHDCVKYNGRYYVTEADNNSVASVNNQGADLKRYKLTPEGYFIRGLILTKKEHYVGFSPLRNGNNDCLIVVFDDKFKEEKRRITIPDLCGLNQKTAIHTMVLQ